MRPRPHRTPWSDPPRGCFSRKSLFGCKIEQVHTCCDLAKNLWHRPACWRGRGLASTSCSLPRRRHLPFSKLIRCYTFNRQTAGVGCLTQAKAQKDPSVRVISTFRHVTFIWRQDVTDFRNPLSWTPATLLRWTQAVASQSPGRPEPTQLKSPTWKLPRSNRR